VEQIVKRDGRVVSFDEAKITTAIWKAMRAVGEPDESASKRLAERVTQLLDERFVGELPTVEEIQDLVEDVLIAAGYTRTAKAYILYRKQHADLRDIGGLLTEPLIENYIDDHDWRVRENSNMSYSLQGLNTHITDKVISRYWLNKIYPNEIRDTHERGDFHIHDLGTLGAYTYYGKEVIVTRVNERIKLLSFERLFNDLPEEAIPLNKADGAYAKYPSDDVYVLDKSGWTKVVQVTQKKKQRPMRFIKNRGGRSVIVTDNHPMITQEGEKEAQEVNGDDSLFTVDLERLFEQEKLFSVGTLDFLELFQNYDWGGDARFYDGVPLEDLDEGARLDGIIHTQSFTAPRHVRLTEDFGYFFGFALAEGFISYNKGSSQRISLTQKNKEPLLQANKGLLDNGISGCLIRKGERYELRVKNPFLRFLFEQVFKINPGARHKSLPIELLHYTKPFVKGVIAGLIDGDGNIESSGTTLSVRVAARTLLEQLAVVMDLLGFVPRDRAIEGQETEHVYRGKKIIQRYPLYGVSFRKIEEDLPSEKYRSAGLSSRAWHDEDRDEWHRVINNIPVEIPDDVIYDITTESGTLIVNGMWNHNCVGWDLHDLLLRGFRGVRGKIEARPAKRFRVALLQVVNFMYTLQGESAGAQAFSNLDTYLAPFIRAGGLSYKEVKQNLQEFVYNMNVPTRVGFQSPFTNVTLDLEVPRYMQGEPVIIGGELQDTVYGDYQREMNLFNRAFAEVMIEGDMHERPFTFPIPTYNITEDFNWENESLEPVWEMTAKYGIPYFSNFIGSDMKPEDTRSMCCRLRIDNRELRKRGGGLFGANPLTGSIGVVTINMPRLGYLAKGESDFFSRLSSLMELAKESLIIKRKTLEALTEKGLYPYSRFYLQKIKQSMGGYWKNHFSTIGLIGMNDALLNLYGTSIAEEKGQAFALKVLDFMRQRLSEFQEEIGEIFNLEATPAEGASYRLAKKDLERYPDIRIYNRERYGGKVPYYTNSTHLPVGLTEDLFEALQLQDPLQTRYTGGTVFHAFLGERTPSPEAIKRLVRKIAETFHLPYYTLTPTFSVCPKHGYISGEHKYCPKCDEELAEGYAQETKGGITIELQRRQRG